MSGTTDKKRVRRREPLSQRIYRELSKDLAAGEFGPGATLGEERLAERYRASRTPVREALVRLISDGLVERRGTMLYPVRSPADGLAEYYDARALIEVAGLDRVRAGLSRAHDPAVLAVEADRWRAMRAEPGGGDVGADIDFVLADDRFHVALLAASGNGALAEALVAVQKKIRGVWLLDYPTPGRTRMIVEDHLVIVDALRAGDLDTARAVLTAHIDDSRRLVQAAPGAGHGRPA
ncbi:FCD domain-containing protein [Gordonia pseudamarae]|jgi:DNA-binding GntR family transcriptional regulator|uniref:FCD domain-containing protein n=1 Tax=Gordonia pseudamarae TaxID=2831662 RepID=A0ABX6IJM1_9ACTN|nr:MULTISPECIES: GntR family transcriptional regulator [Gordonia]MBD0023037.1 GntR family transcriptional regulator [Gordonia sp. (in: high G+C Gram-positive bacteria)]QHN27174.1 FCD domain-containing protein [Gordonia pseudamarae]QHN36064.1 FCD domain-containing protein [Gordonia pseudamarae]